MSSPPTAQCAGSGISSAPAGTSHSMARPRMKLRSAARAIRPHGHAFAPSPQTRAGLGDRDAGELDFAVVDLDRAGGDDDRVEERASSAPRCRFGGGLFSRRGDSTQRPGHRRRRGHVVGRHVADFADGRPRPGGGRSLGRRAEVRTSSDRPRRAAAIAAAVAGGALREPTVAGAAGSGSSGAMPNRRRRTRRRREAQAKPRESSRWMMRGTAANVQNGKVSRLLACPENARHPVDVAHRDRAVGMRRIERGELQLRRRLLLQDLRHDLAVGGADHDAVAAADLRRRARR